MPSYPAPDPSTWFSNALITSALMKSQIIDYINDLYNRSVGATFAAYTPALRAITTNPTLGTGSVQDGRYIQQGKLVVAHVDIIFGTSGTAAGTGNYYVTLPVAAATPSNTKVIGHGHVRGGGGTGAVLVSAQLDNTGQMFLLYAGTPGTATNVSNTAPGAWGANDFLRLTFWYEAA